jgi:hypothetical protein
MREVFVAKYQLFDAFGLWLSLVERLVRDQEAVGSNPTSPMNTDGRSQASVRSRLKFTTLRVWIDSRESKKRIWVL